VVGLFGSETEKVSGGRRGLDRKDKRLLFDTDAGGKDVHRRSKSR
jgi:hypothetical protein